MELVEIIKSSFSIFLAVIIFFSSISYTIFKIKNRSRTKLNLDVHLQNNLNGLINSNNGIGNKRNNEDKYFDEIVLTKHPVQNRFTIMNEDMAALNSGINEYNNENPTHRLIPNIDYKNNHFEKMNKLDPIFR